MAEYNTLNWSPRTRTRLKNKWTENEQNTENQNKNMCKTERSDSDMFFSHTINKNKQ